MTNSPVSACVQGKTLVSGGEKVIGGGINVLESIGKKTYDAIGDHGLKETLRNKPNLSQVRPLTCLMLK